MYLQAALAISDHTRKFAGQKGMPSPPAVPCHLRLVPVFGSFSEVLSGEGGPRTMQYIQLLLAVSLGLMACAPPPVLPEPAPSFEEKTAWILRLEDQRLLRDPVLKLGLAQSLEDKAGVLDVLPPAVPDLTQLLDDSSVLVRRRAALGIGRVRSAEGVEPLVRVLSDPVAQVRQMSAFALGLLGDSAAVEPLVQALLDPSPIVQGRAAEALGLIGDPSAAEAVGNMVASHVTSAFDIAPEDLSYPLGPRVEAFRLGLYALARLDAYEPLAAAILNEDGGPILWWWPVPYALQKLEDPRARKALKLLAEVQGSYGVAFAAAGLGVPADDEAVDILLALLDPQRRDTRVMHAAVRALAETGHPKAERALLRLIQIQGIDQDVVLESIRALGVVGGEESATVLLDLLSHPLPAMRAVATRSLAQLDPENFVIVLSSLDEDKDWRVRSALAETLGVLNSDRVLPRLTAMLGDADLRVVPSVLSTFVKLKAVNATKVLLDNLKSPDLAVRMTAARLIGELKPDEGLPALIEAYERGRDDSSYVAKAAILSALAKYRGPEVISILKTALSDPDWAVRVRAATQLSQLEDPTDATTLIRPVPVRFSESVYEAKHLVSPTVSPHVYIETDKGVIEVELAVLDAPMTVDNFITLSIDGFFDGLVFHRVLPNSLVQAGDPRGDGEGGPGYTIRDEINQIPYLRGTVGMALDGSDTGGSQFFITLSPQPQLDARYTAFGKVVDGIEVADELREGDTIQRVRVWDGITMSRLED